MSPNLLVVVLLFAPVAARAGDVPASSPRGQTVGLEVARGVDAQASSTGCACDGGVAATCARNGALAAGGDGVDADPAPAPLLSTPQGAEGAGDQRCAHVASTYALACEGGDLTGCLDGASRLREGADRDIRAAIALYERVCAAGEPRGCTAVGEVYLTGDGVRPDPGRAFTWFVAGCDAGGAEPCSSAAWLASGHLVGRPDPERAASLYRRGCDAGDVAACWEVEDPVVP